MLCKDIMNKNIIYALLYESIYDVCKKMYEHDKTFIPVISYDTHLIYGIVTYKDILNIIICCDDFSITKIDKYINYNYHTVYDNDDINKCINIMYTYNIGYVLVIDKNSCLVGSILLKDIFMLNILDANYLKVTNPFLLIDTKTIV